MTLTPASSSQYRSNALNQRSYKSAGGRQTSFVYGLDGELLYEVSAPVSSYSEKTCIWFGGEVVALVSAGTTFTVQNDQVGRPLSVQDANRSTVWSARVRAFDRTVLTDQIGGFNIGYPGQYVDAESGLNYNWNRYYEPSLGRYTQSDPIGLAGGINTYAYVGGNPVSAIDLTGLDLVVITGGRRESTNPFGHIAIGVTGSGIYSYGNGTPLGSSVNAYLSSQSAVRNQTVSIIPTTAQQDAAVLAYLASQPGMNSVGKIDNCAVRTNSALGAAGINTGAAPFPGSVARGAMGLPGAQNFFVPQGGPMPAGLLDALRQFTPPNVP